MGCDEPQCLSILRRWLREHLDPDGDEAIDAQLVCTELVTNAVDHAHGPCTVRIDVIDHVRLDIKVDDASPTAAVTPGVSRLSGVRGRGLVLVSKLCEWGVVRHERYKTVWASLALGT